MNKVFYDPNTLEIKGFSDGEVSLSYPFVETEQVPIMLSNYKIILVGEVPTLKIRKESLTDEEWEKEING